MFMRVVVGLRIGRVIIILTILFCSAPFSRALEPMLSIREYFGLADLVVVAQIDDQEELREDGQECGVRYQSTILESFKGGSGTTESRQFTFGRYVGLKRYRTYLLFLNYEKDVLRSYEHMAKEFGFYDRRPNIIDLVACKGTVPGYLFNRKIQWEIVSGDVYLSGLLPKEIPSFIHVFNAGGWAEWRIPTDDLFPYLRMLRDHSVRSDRTEHGKR
jgi:hypothetical protein